MCIRDRKRRAYKRKAAILTIDYLHWVHVIAASMCYRYLKVKRSLLLLLFPIHNCSKYLDIVYYFCFLTKCLFTSGGNFTWTIISFHYWLTVDISTVTPFFHANTMLHMYTYEHTHEVILEFYRYTVGSIYSSPLHTQSRTRTSK